MMAKEVMAAAVACTFVATTLGAGLVARARKEGGAKYPTLYVTGDKAKPVRCPPSSRPRILPHRDLDLSPAQY